MDLGLLLDWKGLLIVAVGVLTVFVVPSAPSLNTTLAIVLILSIQTYAIWVVGVRVNRRLVGRRPRVVREVQEAGEELMSDRAVGYGRLSQDGKAGLAERLKR